MINVYSENSVYLVDKTVLQAGAVQSLLHPVTGVLLQENLHHRQEVVMMVSLAAARGRELNHKCFNRCFNRYC